MIDKTAIVSPKAIIGNNVQVGPYTIISENVEIGDNTIIGPHAVLSGRTKIGKNNKIFHFTSIGVDPQDLKYHGEDTLLEIGDNNVIREYCSIHRGTAKDRGVTSIGNNNLLMAYVHIAHDCVIGNGTVFANNSSLAGHVHVDDFAILSGFAIVAQFCLIGSYSFIAGGTGIAKDVLPYTWVSSYHGSPARSYGINIIGLRRRGIPEETIRNLKKAYHIISKEGLSLKQALPKLNELVASCKEIQLFVSMLQKSKHGVIK